MLLQDGYSPAPFKSQNMSLNSCVTRQGHEMGRAQVTQAQACRLEPDARMNPVLLKPSSDVGSQVIIMGAPVGNMKVREYVAYKPQAFAAAQQAYDSLAAEHDVMVLEGAGSPAEINLKEHDIVNMRMAEYAGATVLLVGDIDRGGVFASFLGTYAFMDPWEQELLAGFVINRFRGDASLLGPALEATTARTGRPFFGVVPFVGDLGLPEEDSVSFKAGTAASKGGGELVVALVDLPHISNFTDIDALAGEPDVDLLVARRPEDLEAAIDVVILPGSKNTIQDLAALRTSGLADAVLHLHAKGCAVVGICGGLQMIGERIADPLGLESEDRGAPGLGLLPLETTLAREKTLLRCDARHVESGLAVSGYEIHHGATHKLPGAAENVSPSMVRGDGEVIGYTCSSNEKGGPVWGSYLHGVFDDDAFRRWFLDGLRQRKGLSPIGRVVHTFDLEPALDRLAAVLREHMDWEPVYKLLGLRPG